MEKETIDITWYLVLGAWGGLIYLIDTAVKIVHGLIRWRFARSIQSTLDCSPETARNIVRRIEDGELSRSDIAEAAISELKRQKKNEV